MVAGLDVPIPRAIAIVDDAVVEETEIAAKVKRVVDDTSPETIVLSSMCFDCTEPIPNPADGAYCTHAEARNPPKMREKIMSQAPTAILATFLSIIKFD